MAIGDTMIVMLKVSETASVRSIRTRMTLLFAWLLALGALAAPPAAALETREYDSVGRLHRVTYANGGMIEYNYDGRGNIVSIVRSLLADGVEPGVEAPAARFALGPATPNPGSGAIRLDFSVPREEHAELRVYDAAGRLVATLADGTYRAGAHVVYVTPRGWAGGVYFYRLEAGGLTATRKLVIAP